MFPAADAATASPARDFEIPDASVALMLAERILVERDSLRPVIGRVEAVPQLWTDLDLLCGGYVAVSARWSLTFREAERIGDVSLALIESLARDPLQGEPLDSSDGASFLRLCRRLRFDPADPAPAGPNGEPWPRLSLLWANQPNEGLVKLTRVLGVVHRLDRLRERRHAAR